MNLKSIILAAGLAVGYAVPAEAAIIIKGSEHFDNPDSYGGMGYIRFVQKYTILSERGDTLESIASQIVQKGISGLEGSSYTPKRVHELVLGQLQRNYPVDPKTVLSTGTILSYDKTTKMQRGLHLNI